MWQLSCKNEPFSITKDFPTVTNPPSSPRRTVSSDKRDRRGLLRRPQRSGVVEPLSHRCGLQHRRHGAGRARAHVQSHLQQLHPHRAALRAAVHSGGQGATRELLQQRQPECRHCHRWLSSGSARLFHPLPLMWWLSVAAQVPASLMASHSRTTALTSRRCCRGRPGRPLRTTTAALNQRVETCSTATVQVPPAPSRVWIVAGRTISLSKPQMARATAPRVDLCWLKQVHTSARLGF